MSEHDINFKVNNWFDLLLVKSSIFANWNYLNIGFNLILNRLATGRHSYLMLFGNNLNINREMGNYRKLFLRYFFFSIKL